MSLFFFILALAIIPLLVTVTMALLVYAEFIETLSRMAGGYEERSVIRKRKMPKLLIIFCIMFVNVFYCYVLLGLIFFMVPSPDHVQERAITIAIALMGSGAILSTIAMKWAISRNVREMVSDPEPDLKGKSRKQIERIQRESTFPVRLIEVTTPQVLATYGLLISILILNFCVGGSGSESNDTFPESTVEPTINESNIEDVEFVGLLIAFSYIPSMITGIIPKWIKGGRSRESMIMKKVLLGVLGSLPTAVCFTFFIVEISS